MSHVELECSNDQTALSVSYAYWRPWERNIYNQCGYIGPGRQARIAHILQSCIITWVILSDAATSIFVYEGNVRQGLVILDVFRCGIIFLTCEYFFINSM